ncbi:Uncharacterized protein TCM_021843 [Theobroma cacao]|uniref:Uncharacterized protein n=1 Tax=Theobroma cacao TaxID=3641 RepID=A0A061EYP2_THECC|nr:Uncharacterized protein TCM_021843 [Theobroma cacao]
MLCFNLHFSSCKLSFWRFRSCALEEFFCLFIILIIIDVPLFFSNQQLFLLFRILTRPQSGAPLPGNVGNGSILPSFEHLVSLLKRAFGFHSDINLVPDIESVRTGLYHV